MSDGGHGLHIYLNSASVCVAIKSKTLTFLNSCVCVFVAVPSAHLVRVSLCRCITICSSLLPWLLLLPVAVFSNRNFHFFHFFLCRWFILFCIALRMRMQTHSSTIMIFSLSTFVVQHFFHWNSQGAVIYIFICVAVAILLLLLLLRFFFLNYDRVIVISVEGKKIFH